MEDLENNVIPKLSFTVTVYKRYVDDIFLAIPEGNEEEVKNIFNSYHELLQITIELGQNKRINFSI